MKRKIQIALLWGLSLTWGLPLTLVGLITAVALMRRGCKPRHFHGLLYFIVDEMEIGEGIDFGPVFLVGPYTRSEIKIHEAGHAIQNLVFGPLFPILVGIPSLIRCRYRRHCLETNPHGQLPDYDAVWFEGQATRLGNRLFYQPYNLWENLPKPTVKGEE